MIYLIIDLVLICIALGIVARSWRQGLVSSVIRLVGAVASYAGAWIMSGPLSRMLYSSFVRAPLVSYAEGLIPPDLQKMADSFAAMGGNSSMLEQLGLGNLGELIGEYLQKIVAELGLDSLPFSLVDTDKAGGEIASNVLEGGFSIAEALTEALLQPIAMMALRVVCFAVVFGLLSFLVSFLYRVGFGFNKLPLIGSFNHLFGAGIGALEACIVVYILCMTIAIASALLGNKFEFLSWDNLEQARLLSYVVGLTPPAGLGIL